MQMKSIGNSLVENFGSHPAQLFQRKIKNAAIDPYKNKGLPIIKETITVILRNPELIGAYT